jgi:hypothetical protein
MTHLHLAGNHHEGVSGMPPVVGPTVPLTPRNSANPAISPSETPTFSPDHNGVSPLPLAHSGEPKSVSFADSSASGSDALTDLMARGQLDGNDPQVAEILAVVRDAEQQNIQTLLDAMDRSLEYARKMMEANQRHYYEKILPQVQHLKADIQETSALEQSDQQNALRRFQSQLGTVMAELQQSEAQGTLGNPAVDALELARILAGSGLR